MSKPNHTPEPEIDGIPAPKSEPERMQERIENWRIIYWAEYEADDDDMYAKIVREAIAAEGGLIMGAER